MEEETEQQQSKNYYRLVTLLTDIGGEALRDVLLNEFPQNQLGTAIQNNITSLSRLKSMKVLTEPQFDLLQETPPDPNKFDISLLVALLRNLCPHIKPVPDWEISVPDPGDHSMRDEVMRIKNIRNKFMHISTTSMPKSTFQQLWLDLAVTIIRIALNVSPECGEKIWTKVVLLKVADIDPAGEKGRQLHSTLVDWKRQIIDKTQIIDSLDEKVNSLQSSFESLHLKSDRVSQLTEDVSIIRQDVSSMSYQAQGGGDSVPAQRSDITNNEEQLLYLRRELASMKYQNYLLSERTQTGEGVDVADAAAKSQNGNLKKTIDNTMSDTVLRQYTSIMDSVGALVVGNQLIGTVFRVGSKYVMTALHCIHGIIDPFKNGDEKWDILREPQVLITFNYQKVVENQTVFSILDAPYHNKELDIIVLELSEPSKLPPMLKLYFGNIPYMAVQYVDIIGYGYPGSNQKRFDSRCNIIQPIDPVMREAQAWLQNEKGRLKQGLKEGVHPDLLDWGFHGYDRPEKMIYNCYLEHGSSGGPVLTSKYPGVPAVVGVVTNGLPHCFWNLSSTAQLAFPEKYRFEMGTRMAHIYQALGAFNIALANELFQ